MRQASSEQAPGDGRQHEHAGLVDGKRDQTGEDALAPDLREVLEASQAVVPQVGGCAETPDLGACYMASGPPRCACGSSGPGSAGSRESTEGLLRIGQHHGDRALDRVVELTVSENLAIIWS